MQSVERPRRDPMTTPSITPLNRLFVPAGFLAVPVVAIILILVTHPDPLVVRGLAELAVAYLGWLAATRRRTRRDGAGPQPA
jgi:hypothetical protein